MRLPSYFLLLPLLFPGIMGAQGAPASINVRQAGAMGNGVTDDTAVIQRALDGGHRTVVIPAGTYVISSTLLVDSETDIQADPKAIIRLADHAGKSADSFILTNRDRTKGNTDITVEGGIWDGNNVHNPRGLPHQQPCYTGVALNFINVHRLTLRNLVIRNPESYFFRACHLDHFLIENIGFDNNRVRPNQDGIHLNGFCENGVIRDLHALAPWATNDDMVALNADDGFKDVMNQGMVVGPIRNLTIEKLRAGSTYTFVRMLSYRQPIENITVSDVVGGCRHNVLNMDSWEFPKDGGNIRNITLRNFNVRRAADAPTENAANLPLLTAQVAVHGLRIENFHRDADDHSPSPTMMIGNKQPMRIELEGLNAQQKADLLAHSPMLTPGMSTEVKTGEATSYTLLQKDKTGLVTLPSGGFPLLTIDSVGK